MIPVQVRITTKLAERIDELIEHGMYPNRSEAIRDAIRRNVNYFHESGIVKASGKSSRERMMASV